MSFTEKMAIAAHLHVLLRRKTGRVTDTEWLASNGEYAAEITRFARQKATEDGCADLAVWATKLEQIMATPVVAQRTPLASLIATAANARKAPAASAEPVANRPTGRAVDPPRAAPAESGFMESTFGSFFGDGATPAHRKPREPIEPRYVKGLR